MRTYRDELSRAMSFLGSLENSVFLGQAVEVPGTAMFGTLAGVDPGKRIELPVEEDFQMGLSIGLAMAGHLPISIYPRWNFLILAANQIINHLDKLAAMTQETPPAVIIRTSIGSERPLHPGPQHTGDLSSGIALLAPTLHVEVLEEAADIFPAYERAATRSDGVSSLLVEYGDYYAEK